MVSVEKNQVFVHWELWEDYHAGMWRRVPKGEEDTYRKTAIEFTGDYPKYGAAMLRVITEWPNTCMHNLTNPSINRRAFVGHAACALVINCPEYIVRQAWWKLTEEQRILADKEADKAIEIWEQNRKLKRILNCGNRDVIRLGYQTRLPLR